MKGRLCSAIQYRSAFLQGAALWIDQWAQMSTYDPTTRHLHICRHNGVGVKNMGRLSRASLRAKAWSLGTVTFIWETFPVHVRRSSDPKYPLLFKPLKIVRYSKFDQFFGFRTSDDYDPDRVVAVAADTIRWVASNDS